MCGNDIANARDKPGFLHVDLNAAFLGLGASAELRNLRKEAKELHVLSITVTVSSRFRMQFPCKCVIWSGSRRQNSPPPL